MVTETHKLKLEFSFWSLIKLLNYFVIKSRYFVSHAFGLPIFILVTYFFLHVCPAFGGKDCCSKGRPPSVPLPFPAFSLLYIFLINIITVHRHHFSSVSFTFESEGHFLDLQRSGASACASARVLCPRQRDSTVMYNT
jgi:hypothetical protein